MVAAVKGRELIGITRLLATAAGRSYPGAAYAAKVSAMAAHDAVFPTTNAHPAR